MEPTPEQFLEYLRNTLPTRSLAEIRRVRNSLGRKLSRLANRHPELEDLSYSGPMDPNDSADQIRCLRLAVAECEQQIALRGKAEDDMKTRSERRLQRIGISQLKESLAKKQEQLHELKKIDANWRLWGVSVEPGPSERIGLQLTREIEELNVERIRRIPAPGLQERDTAPVNREDFNFSDDFRSVRFNGSRHELTLTQARIVEYLYRARERGTPEVTGARLLTELDMPSSRLRDSFRKSPLWRTLVVQGKRKGTYRLNLPGNEN